MYNNPFLYQTMARPGLFSRLLGGGALRSAASGGINWGTLLANTQKSLGIINQAIPLVYQVKPIFENAKTMFRIAGAMKDDSSKKSTTQKNNRQSTSTQTTINNDNKPVFYI